LTLVELVMFIVIVSVGLAGTLLVMDRVTRSNADPVVRKQAIAVAEAMLEEVLLKDFAGDCPDGLTCAANTPSDRPNYATVDHYNGWNQTGVQSLTAPTTNIVGLGTYTVQVAVAATALGDIPAGSGDAKRITVTVTPTQGEPVTIDGYRSRY